MKKSSTSHSLSPLHKERLLYQPDVPEILSDVRKVFFKKGRATSSVSDQEALKKRFPHTFSRPLLEGTLQEESDASPLKVGVVFSGGQASGGHNVIAGLFDALQSLHPDSKLLGFLGGPSGIVENAAQEITKELLKNFRNMGGFDLIGSGRTKIETEEQLEKSLATCKNQKLDGLIIIGGDDSNTNAAVLAEYFLEKGCATSVVGVPKTIDGDLRNENIEISFGFDTACKTYSEMIGNICRDALSAKKYYHFVKLMGRSASHIALECAHKTHPNLTLISEEVAEEKKTLKQIIDEIADVIEKRAEKKKDYGVILIPEGLIEFIPEIKSLIKEINEILAKNGDVEKDLSGEAKKAFAHLPEEIRKQLLLDRDPHGNVQVSKIETENLLLLLVKEELKKRGKKCNALRHFFGYEGRSCMPSNFDANYCYSLGLLAALLIRDGMTGYMACISHLKESPKNWLIKGIPITMLMNLETRHGKEKPVIKKALVNLEGTHFQKFAKERSRWALEDEYLFPGPIQFAGPSEVTDPIPFILSL